ncbi:MAG: alpha/beta hydrolase [Syntrophobacteraceae bacterium]|nr:alpha/beta hydrolase [Desulfobacteraceae bacterium]
MTILYAAALVYVILAFALFLFQSRLIYFPERRIVGTPHDMGLPFDVVSFKTQDGLTLSGWFVPGGERSAVMLCCHGNAGNISDRLLFVEFLHRLHVSVFLFDYRGYGDSEGMPEERGTYLDAAAAWQYLVEERKVVPGRIVVHGQSLGGPIAAWLAREKNPAALILESTFTSLPDLASQIYPFFPVRLLARYKYCTEKYLQGLRCPVLIIHSREDETVPYEHGTRLYQVAHEPKRFLELRGDHNGCFLTSGDSYAKALDEYIQQYTEK